LLALGVALSIGKIAEMQVPGSFSGVGVSSAFFLVVATCAHSVLPIFFYRQPES